MRLTEADNPLTAGLDRLPGPDRLLALAAAEAELFGSSWGLGLMDPHVWLTLQTLQSRLRAVEAAGGTLVVGGAGTSGRLGILALAAHRTAETRRLQRFATLAGGPSAFFQAREGVEDDPAAGARDLQAALNGSGPAFYLGISCGLSAAYIAGQIDHALSRPQTTVAVLGFNPWTVANPRPLTALNNRSFYDLLQSRATWNDGFLLTPLLGPEPITGSTRMKGGSATKIILDLLLAGADPRQWIQLARTLHTHVHNQAPALASLTAQASAALRAGGSLVYLGKPRSAAIAALDASECPPTFGARPDQVRCYPSRQRDAYLGFAQTQDRADQLGPHDLLLGLEPGAAALLPADFNGVFRTVPESPPLNHFLETLPNPAWRPHFAELALKWTLNMISTDTFIGYGKVAGNRMIDLRISNLKLWERAIRIIADQAAVDPTRAEAALNAVLTQDGSAPTNPVEGVRRAVVQERVIPRAIAACGQLTQGGLNR